MAQGVPNDISRFLDLVEVTETCWLWFGKIHKGYGTFSMDGRKQQAHRLFWEFVNGPVPQGLELDHLCRVRHCVNPDHLEPVTHAENIGRAPVHVTKRRSVCKNGHPLTGDNVVTWTRASGLVVRDCRECKNARQRKRWHAKKAA